MSVKRTVFLLVFILGTLVFIAQSVSSAEDAKETATPSASVSTSSSSSASPKISLPPFSPINHDLTVGEKHVYEISYKNLAAGIGTIEVMEKSGALNPQYTVEMKAESSKWVAMLYPVKDVFKSIIHARKGYALQFERHMREGRNAKHFRDEVIKYDYKELKFNYSSTKDKKKEPKTFSLPGTKYVLDPLAAVMYLRGLDLKVNGQYSLPVHSSSEDWVLKLNCTGLVGLRVPGIGKFKAYKIVPDTKEDALFTSKGVMTIWVEKETKVILRAEVDIPIGKIVIRMIKAENTPLTKVNRQEKRRRWIRPGTKDIP